MRADIAKSPLGYLAEFHCHTRRSFDAYTSEEELLRVCLRKGIGLLTVTEHDRLPALDSARFAAAGVHVIRGCEFSCERGAHIIGLFISQALPKGSRAAEIFRHIRAQRGLIMIPHPFKSGSGFCTLYADHERYLPEVSLIEAYNGGMSREAAQPERVRELAVRYRLKTVAASDAHQVNQVGYYVTAYDELLDGDVRTTLSSSQGRLLVDGSYVRRPRRVRAVQRMRLWQKLMARVPNGAKRLVKLGLYQAAHRSYRPPAPLYTELA